MEFFGLIAFILVVTNSSLPDKVKKLQGDVKKIKNSIRGEVKMYEILKELEGKRCTLTVLGNIFGEPKQISCEVINVDGEWMKINQTIKKNQSKIKIIRIDDIKEVTIV